MHEFIDYPKGLATMKNLYVIGNGFDIAHGLPSRYLDFKKWLQENQMDIYEKLIEFFPDVANEDLKWWSDFENNLDTLSAHEAIFRNASEYYPDFGSDEFRDRDYHRAEYETEQEIRNLYYEIQKSFELWVKQLGKPIKKYKLKLPTNTFFLTFNYTDTLQDYYKISSDNILYIHGRESIGDSLIFGHSGNPYHITEGTELEYPEPPNKLDPEDYEQWIEQNSDDYFVISARQAAQHAIYEFKKPTEELISKYRIFFGRCSNLESITFLGLSFSSVDIPYLDAIFNHIDLKNIKITAYYFSGQDFKSITSFMNRYNIPQNNLTILHSSIHPHKEYINPEIPNLFDV